MSSILAWLGKNRIPAAAIFVLVGGGLAGQTEITEWTTQHQNQMNFILALVGVIGTLWPTIWKSEKK